MAGPSDKITEGGKIVTASGASGVGLTSAAFKSAFSWFPYVLAIAVVNIIGLYFLMSVVKQELESYMTRLKSGEIKKFS